MTTTITIELMRSGTDEHGSYDYQETWVTPAKWKICPRCEGCGTDRGASVECDGGGFTRPCNSCTGSGKVLVIDRKMADPVKLKLYDEERMEEREYQQLCRMERLLGC